MKYTLAILIAFLILQIVILAPQPVNVDSDSSTGVGKNKNLPSSPPNGAEQAMRGVHLIEATEGTQEWELWSEEAFAFKTRNVWELKKVKVILFGEKGVQFTVRGEQGEIETSNKNLSITGDVVTHSSNGYIFKTQTVGYESKTRVLHSPGQVEMMGPVEDDQSRLLLTGEGMKANFHTSLIEIDHSVRAEKNISKQKKHMIIKSDGAQFSGQKRLAKFLGNVVIDMEDMRVTGPEAEFEYDSKGQNIKSIAIKGGVRVSDTEKWATSQDLKIFFDDNRFVFRGSPRVVQDNDELHGEEIIFLDGGKQVMVKKARAKVDEKALGKPR